MNTLLPISAAHPPQVVTLPVPSPVDLLRGLSEHYREALLVELLAQKMRTDPDCSIFPIAAEGGPVGTFLRADSPSAAADAMYAQLDPATRANVMKPFVEFDWDNCVANEEVESVGGG